MANKTVTLNDGNKMPALGLGTWQSAPGEVTQAVSYALKNGYKLVDGAYCYANEAEVGQGIKEALDSGIKREDIFVVTKIWCTYMSRVEEGLDKSLKELGLDYVDLVLVHWPVLMNPEGNHDRFPKLEDGSRDIIWDWNHVESWKLMEKLPATGKTKSIGVSNYSKKFLEELLPKATIKPAVNQIENHPLLPQSEIVELCKEHDIKIMAYSPFGSTGGPLFKAEPVVKIAQKKGVSPATILLSWHVAAGRIVVPKSVTPERIASNKDVVELDADDLKVLDDFVADINERKAFERFVYPAFGVDFGFPDKS